MFLTVLLMLWQLDLRQPEIVDAAHEALERLQPHGLGEVAVRLQLIALHDVRFRLGRGQDDGGDRLQVVIALDVRQDLAAIHSGKIQIQQDEVRPRGIAMWPLAPQEGHGLHAVGGHV